MCSTFEQNVVYAKGCTNIDQLNQLTSPSDDMAFFHNPPNDHQIYHVTCKLLSKGNIDNIKPFPDHIFYHQIDDNFYQITCILISHSLIVQFLNKKIYGIELRQGEEQQQERLTFSNDQRDNLEFHLREFLLTSKQINKKPNVNVLTKCSNVDNKFISQPRL